MRHYHGTPLGGTVAGTTAFAKRRFLLVPWKRPEDLRAAMTVSAGFIVDNSAFSFWSSGEKPDWNKYIDWVMSLAGHPKFDWCLIPDVIDGTTDDNKMLLAKWHKKAPLRVAAVPVWHMHEPLEHLEWMIQHYERIAIGSSGEYQTPGVGNWWDRMDEAMDVICDRDGVPKAKLHGLRMLNPRIIEAYPWSSCDSTNAAQNGAREANNHGVDCATSGREMIAMRIEATQSPAKWCRQPAAVRELF